MALVKTGGGITDLRGSISGNTFSRSRSGITVRARTKPVQPHFSPHHVSKANFSHLVEAWINDLTESHRSAWISYANAIEGKNKLGESIHLTGQLQFIRSNMTRLLIGLPYVDAGPTVLSLSEKDTTLKISASSDTQKITITFDSTLGWANEQGGYLVVFQSRPQKLTRNSYTGPWLFSAYFAGSSIEAPTPPYEFDSVFPLSSCNRIFLKFIFLRADGRASGPVYTNCIIEKEPLTCLADKPIDVLPCNDSTRWSISNCTVMNDPAHHLCSSMNNQTVKITVNKWAGVWGHVTLTYPQIQTFFDHNGKAPYVLIRFFVHQGSGDSSYTHIQYVRLYFGDTPFTSYFGNYVTSSDYLLPGWNLRVCAPLTWYTSGSPAWNNIKKVRVEILTKTSGKNPSISIDEIRVMPRPQKPVVLFSMDDGTLSQLDVANYLASKNIKGTFYIVPTWIGQPGKLTLANLQTMQAQGHLIANHTNTHPAWHLVGDAAFISDVNAAALWLSQNGFTEGSRLLAIPNGTEDWPANGKDVLLGKVVDSVRLTYWPPGMVYKGVMPYRRDLIHVDSHDSVANALTSLTNCKIDSSQSLPFFHNSSLGGVYSWADLQGYIDSLAVERYAGNILIKTPLDREVLPS